MKTEGRLFARLTFFVRRAIIFAAASNKSLGIMLLMAAIGAPLVASYTIFVFWTFRGKVKLDETSY